MAKWDVVLVLLPCLGAFVAMGGVVVVDAAIPEHRVTHLPGVSDAEFQELPPMFAGHISLDNLPDVYGSHVKYFYYLVLKDTSASPDGTDSTSASTVAWHQGGPGGSALAGLLLEHGPVLIDYCSDTGNVTAPPRPLPNPNSFHHLANMVYVDHPPPTGFSQCVGVCEWDDASQAVLGRLFYEAFFKAYPELLKGLSQKFYLAGESYAGILVPTIAKEILQPTTTVTGTGTGHPSAARLPLQGIMLNNACAGNEEEACPAYGRIPNWAGARAYVEFQHHRQMLSEDMYTRIQVACAGHWGPGEPPAACKALLKDPYWPAQQQTGNEDLMGGGYYLFNPNGRLANQMSLSQRWLDLTEVREALHVAHVTKAFKFVTVPQNYGYTMASLVDTYTQVLVPNLRILHLSGDSDPCVPTESTLAWIRKLGLGTVSEWSPYLSLIHI
eukprot:TRINITY_DN18435_c0_g1_i5.p1 TRINITY_DN18435_c0_g1~~TRINITY_DN18435_c0_g1_i5.p1  ORF type:complete len:441 (+),score=51.99 TRINITY_DN18435_c0_g1_i5:154-1476(+)